MTTALAAAANHGSLPVRRRPRVAILATGDELVARLAYQAEGAGSVQIALRSLEDPDGTEASESWAVAAGEKGAREVKLAADPQQPSFAGPPEDTGVERPAPPDQRTGVERAPPTGDSTASTARRAAS